METVNFQKYQKLVSYFEKSIKNQLDYEKNTKSRVKINLDLEASRSLLEYFIKRIPTQYDAVIECDYSLPWPHIRF